MLTRDGVPGQSYPIMQASGCTVAAVTALVSAAALIAIAAPVVSAQSCMDLAVEDETAVRLAHISVVKRAILFKLQMTQEPENPRGTVVVPEAVEEEYRAVSAAQSLVSKQQTGCGEQPEVPPQFVLLHPQQVLRRAGYHGVNGELSLTVC